MSSPNLALWETLVNGLPAFLAVWQARSGQTVKPQQQRDLHYLFAVWRQQDDLPVDLETYGLRIRPLLCRDPDQQQQFMAVWAGHWREPGDDQAPATQPANPAIRREAETLLEEQRSGLTAAELRRRRKQRRQLWVLAVLLIVLAGLLYPQFFPLQSVEKVSNWPTTIVQPDTAGQAERQTTQTAPARPYLTQMPLRQLPPLYTVDPQDLRSAEYWLAGIAAALFGLPLIWLWRKRRVQFRRGLGEAGEDLRLRAPKASLAPLLGAGAKQLFGRLRFAASGERRIDWQQTVRAIARSGGYPQLRYRQRQRQTDFVLIADRRHRDDQSAWLLAELLDSLKQAQIRVHRYHFDRHPQWLWPQHRENARPQALAEVLWLHPGSRVLLVVEHEVLFYRLTGEPQSWLQAFKTVPEYRLALTTPPNRRQLECLQRAKYRYSVVDRLADLSPLLDFAADVKPERQQADTDPAKFRRDWLGNLPPDDPQLALDWIENSYGKGVVGLLSLLAVYPGLHGDLSRALYDYAAAAGVGKSFKPADLLTVLGLPWCRQGWLPRWLRQALLAQMSAEDRRLAQDFFRTLFDRKKRPGHVVQLHLHKPPAVWRLWLQFWASRGGYRSPWRDGVYAEILLLPRWQWLQKMLPRRLLTALPEWLLGAWPQRLALLALAAIYAGMVAGGWDLYGRAWWGRQQLAAHQAENADQLVTIVHHSSALAAAEALGYGLAAMGYKVAKIADDSVTESRLDAPAPRQTELRDVVQQMTWGGEFPFGAETAQAAVYLAALPQTGQLFRDPRPQNRAATAYPAQLDWQPAPSEIQLKRPDPNIDRSVEPILPNLVPIPAGQFTMGSPDSEPGRDADEGPQHEVKLAAFQLAEAELTFNEWERCVQAKACRQVEDHGWGSGNRPVINVNWDDAQSYIAWLNKRLNLSGDAAYRLPSEAEWEYAARAGSQTAYYWGNAKQCDYANGADQSLKKDKDWSYGDSWTYADCADGYAYTAPVKSFKANNFKLYDMSGNVWEWVQDCYHDNYQGAPADGRAWEKNKCETRALRGGSWFIKPSILRSANRDGFRPVAALDFTGFRLARTR
ncbi:SUMF1/EgtB/PvdO family nonheme iron enzyme [Methylomonas sp. HYX-M1]|uniref:SUMF1/EgtB/PvdO family nonheme iron enzyme n=1 Tax=Methylomonas sp. HYX-M1 TaxID=3139307 RepID=UPI00345B8D13